LRIIIIIIKEDTVCEKYFNYENLFPFHASQERHRMKQLLAAQELLFPKLFASLQAAMKPLMARNRTGLEGGGVEGRGRAGEIPSQTELDCEDDDDI
jgi:hypothetical protein